jgi:hypothetical protein
MVVETLRASGTETRMGSKLFSAFVGAGLPAPSMRLEAVIGGGTNSSDPLQLIADLTVSLSTTIEELGVASVADTDPDTLLNRMRREAQANGSVVVGHFQFGAWSSV